MAASPSALGGAGELARVGAALGVLVGPAVAHGSAFGGLGFSGAWVGVLAALVGALLGGLSWPHFVRRDLPPGPVFASLFGAVVGLLAGGAVAFPMGAVFGVGGGATGAFAGTVAMRISGARGWGRAGMLALVGSLVSAATAAWMSS
jgi:hypothetical protein